MSGRRVSQVGYTAYDLRKHTFKKGRTLLLSRVNMISMLSTEACTAWASSRVSGMNSGSTTGMSKDSDRLQKFVYKLAGQCNIYET